MKELRKMDTTEKILHVIPMDKFTLPFIEFINASFPGEHFFYIRGKKDSKTDFYNNVKYIGEFSKKEFSRALSSAKGLVIHCFSLEFMMNYVFPHIKCLKKTCWVIWGRDLYVYNEYNKTIKGRIYNVVTSFFVKRMSGVAVFAPKDAEYAREWLGLKGGSVNIVYPSTIKKKDIDEIVLSKEKHSGINIVLGNSASATNCHKEAMHFLSRFKDCDIKLYVPLSYGDVVYRDYIIKLGRELFGEKFVPITEYMDANSYVRMLSKMDVAVYNNDRQQARGNIEILSYLGAKVFLKKGYPMWNLYVERQGLPFSAVEDIKDMSLEELAFYSEKDKDDIENYFSRIWDNQILINIWKEVWALVN